MLDYLGRPGAFFTAFEPTLRKVLEAYLIKGGSGCGPTSRNDDATTIVHDA